MEVALEAAKLAGEYLQEEYARFQVIPNAPADISTAADRQSQEIILKFLHAAFPEDALCAEEETPSLAGIPATGKRVWIVDPIDGTRGFAQKIGEFSVMVALVEDGTIALGVVLQPAASRLTYASRGAGCWRRDSGQDPLRCQVSQVRELSQATFVQSRSRTPGKPSRAVLALEPCKVLETYSAGIKLALVARGEADLYLNTYDAFHDWDICAGHILVTEAGGVVTGSHGEELHYGLPGAWQRQGLLASNGLVHEQALGRLKVF